MRNITAKTIAPILAATGYRFSKHWRWGDTAIKAFVYDYLLCTVKANNMADRIARK